MKNEDDDRSKAVSANGRYADQAFTSALAKIVTADAASSRAAIQASKATKPSLHTRFVHDPVKDRA